MPLPPFTPRLAPLALVLGLLLGAAPLGACLTAAEIAALDEAAAEPAVDTPADDRVRTVQLYPTGDEAGLPIIALTRGPTLTLSFDVLGEGGGRPLSVEVVHTDRQGRPDLLPTEFVTSFDRDDLVDYRPSGATAVPYTHYTYTFPNATIGFRISGAYRLRVTEPGSPAALFEVPFYVSEDAAQAELFFGTTLADGAAPAIQPAVRVRPGTRLAAFQAFQYTACFARNGRLGRLRCAPEPGLLGLALFQFYLPRAEAFAAPAPLFQFDLGALAIGPDVTDVDYAARPALATLDLDQAAFGGRLREAANAEAPLIASVFRDGGQAATDAEYVDVRFRYVPPGERASPGPVYVVGPFTGGRLLPEARMTWLPEAGRYEATLRLKQGRYVYGYAAPDEPARRRSVAIGQPSLYTALVFLADPQRGTDRLVAVQSAVAR